MLRTQKSQPILFKKIKTKLPNQTNKTKNKPNHTRPGQTPKNFISKFLFLVLGAMEIDEKVKLPVRLGALRPRTAYLPHAPPGSSPWPPSQRDTGPLSPPCHLADNVESQPIPADQLHPWKSWDHSELSYPRVPAVLQLLPALWESISHRHLLSDGCQLRGKLINLVFADKGLTPPRGICIFIGDCYKNSDP